MWVFRRSSLSFNVGFRETLSHFPLELIQALRRIVGLNIGQIRLLVKMADDGVPRLDLLAAVQRVVLRLENYATTIGGDPAAATDAVVRLRGWRLKP